MVRTADQGAWDFQENDRGIFIKENAVDAGQVDGQETATLFHGKGDEIFDLMASVR